MKKVFIALLCVCREVSKANDRRLTSVPYVLIQSVSCIYDQFRFLADVVVVDAGVFGADDHAVGFADEIVG